MGPPHRSLVVVADDYGIGEDTSRGILSLCRAGSVSGTVLLVNSPFAEVAVRAWHKAGVNADLGWHPCLTLDAPVMPPWAVPSLVNHDGKFLRLRSLATRVVLGRLCPNQLLLEFSAQLRRFRELTGSLPAVVNSHHHVQVFAIIGEALREALRDAGVRPFLRRVCEPRRTLNSVPGARAKRLFLSTLGQVEARRQGADGFPGCDMLAGITDPPCVHDSAFFSRWLHQSTGTAVELTCHPGERDESLLGRDARPGDGNLERRVRELKLLARPDFIATATDAGFRLVRPSEIGGRKSHEMRKAG